MKIGDRVRMIKNLCKDNCYNQDIGKVGVITEILESKYKNKVEFGVNDIGFLQDEELELLNEFKPGDKVIIKESELSKNKELYKYYNHLVGKILEVNYKSEVIKDCYKLSGVESYKKWIGVGIDGKYVDVIPMFKDDMLERVYMITSNYVGKSSIIIENKGRLNLFDSSKKPEVVSKCKDTNKTNRIKRNGCTGTSIIEYFIDENKREIEFSVSGNQLNVSTLFKILLHETGLEKYTYERVSPFKMNRVYNRENQQHEWTLEFIDIRDYSIKSVELLQANRYMAIENKTFKIFIPDLLEILVERNLLQRVNNGYKLTKNLDTVMECCEYLKCKPNERELRNQGFTIPKGYKNI